jgi:hypothetical protein
MGEIVALVGTLTQAGWKVLYAVAVIALGSYAVSRGHRAAVAEQAEESRERRAA